MTAGDEPSEGREAGRGVLVRRTPGLAVDGSGEGGGSIAIPVPGREGIAKGDRAGLVVEREEGSDVASGGAAEELGEVASGCPVPAHVFDIRLVAAHECS